MEKEKHVAERRKDHKHRLWIVFYPEIFGHHQPANGQNGDGCESLTEGFQCISLFGQHLQVQVTFGNVKLGDQQRYGQRDRDKFNTHSQRLCNFDWVSAF